MQKITLMLTIALFTIPSTYPMSIITKNITTELLKNSAKKATSAFMTSLHWGISAGPFLFMGTQRVIQHRDENKSIKNSLHGYDSDPNVTDFIKNNLVKVKHKNITIQTVPSLDQYGSPMSALAEHIIISPSTEEEIKLALKTGNQAVLNKYLGILGHEETHIYHNHTLMVTAIGTALPFITHGSFKILRYALPFAKKTQSFLATQLIKIPTAIGKLNINLLGITFMSRNMEYCADDGIPNDINLLSGIRDFFIDTEQQRDQATTDKGITEKTLDFITSFYQSHPPIKNRIQRFNQRIALLKAQNDKKVD